MTNDTPGGTGNGAPQHLHECGFNSSHKFSTLDALYSHTPSCPDNPDRVDDDQNPER